MTRRGFMAVRLDKLNERGRIFVRRQYRAARGAGLDVSTCRLMAHCYLSGSELAFMHRKDI